MTHVTRKAKAMAAIGQPNVCKGSDAGRPVQGKVLGSAPHPFRPQAFTLLSGLQAALLRFCRGS